MLTEFCKSNSVRYFGVFLGIAGANANLPAVLAWQANNIRGHDVRAIASGLQIAAGAIGGIYASLTFQQKQAPHYTGGLWATAAAQFALIIGALVILAYNYFANKRADNKRVLVEGLEGFRYTY